MASEAYPCLPLDENLAPAWTSPNDFQEWHARIWTYPVDAANFGAQVFTKFCLMEGPRKIDTLRGAVVAAELFRRLFARYPHLSGEHITWAYNENQIFLNWCFVTTGGKELLKVPVCDIFCVSKGKVQYRLTTFDTGRMEDALNRAYPPAVEAPPEQQLGFEYLWARWHQEPGPTLPGGDVA